MSQNLVVDIGNCKYVHCGKDVATRKLVDDEVAEHRPSNLDVNKLMGGCGGVNINGCAFSSLALDASCFLEFR